MRVLIFTYEQWNDDKGAGWDSFAGAFQVRSFEEARKEVEQINNGNTRNSGQCNYQIVDMDRLVLLERGKIQYEWAAGGYPIINSKAVPDDGSEDGHDDGAEAYDTNLPNQY